METKDLDKNEAEDKQQKMSLERGAQPEYRKTWDRTEWRNLPVVSKRFTVE